MAGGCEGARAEEGGGARGRGIITRWLSSRRRASTSVVSREIVATGILPSKPSAALRICGSGSRISARSLPSGTSGRGG